MGFYIQDDYYTSATCSLSKREQEQFWATLIRYYFDESFDPDSVKLTKAVRGMFGTVRGRIDRSRSEAVRKRIKRNESRTVRGQSADTLRRTYTEREGEREVVDDDVLQGSRLVGPDEIGSEPEGFAAFMAACLRAYNDATGQLYMAATAASRRGMLEAFRAGRTVADVERVMADVAGWEPRYQTLDAVFADGKLEKHINREGGGCDVPDFSEFNGLAVRAV